MGAALEDAVVIPRFYLSSIHEQRPLAYIARTLPLGLYLLSLFVLLASAIWCEWLLLVMCASLNLTMWVWLSSTAAFAILGACLARSAQEAQPPCGDSISRAKGTSAAWCHTEWASLGANTSFGLSGRSCFGVRHLIVLPNYQVEEDLLTQTLEALSQASTSIDFCIVLAMEAREGHAGQEKARRLQGRFACRFARVLVSTHPECSTDRCGTSFAEGENARKASNLKWAVSWAFQELNRREAIDWSTVLLTVADADCIFHPSYFAHVHSEFCAMQECSDDHYVSAIWQAPQLPFRHYFQKPHMARVWAHMSSVFDFGGVSSLLINGQSMRAGTYTLPLQLALGANAWDGDVVSDDQHCFSKCFFFSLYNALATADNSLEDRPNAQINSTKTEYRTPDIKALKVRPVFLPVKSALPASSVGMWKACSTQWQQARHRCHGISECCYSVLATLDFSLATPINQFSMRMLLRMLKVSFLPLLMHMVPMWQMSALLLLVARWFAHGRSLNHCNIGDQHLGAGNRVLCDLVGLDFWMSFVAVPMVLFMLADFIVVLVVFLRPIEKRLTKPGQWTIWDAEDGNIPKSAAGNSYDLRCLLYLVLVDGLLMTPLLLPFSFAARLLSYWNLCRGNDIKYTSKPKLSSYGTLSAFGPPQCY
jgi:hypothetical protein